MKILNLYAGIGGNRKLWGDEHEITAIENNPEIAAIYQSFFPKDKVVIADAHNYLLEHYKEFDFIWSSPPCPTHSRLNFSFINQTARSLKFPDMKLYQEIIFLKSFFKGKWVVENVLSYYEPLIKPYLVGRHYFWANFYITNFEIETSHIRDSRVDELALLHDFPLESINIRNKRQILRNCVNPKLAFHIWKCAFKEKQQSLIEVKQ